jgi:hypothetical protein
MSLPHLNQRKQQVFHPLKKESTGFEERVTLLSEAEGG